MIPGGPIGAIVLGAILIFGFLSALWSIWRMNR